MLLYQLTSDFVYKYEIIGLIPTGHFITLYTNLHVIKTFIKIYDSCSII